MMTESDVLRVVLVSLGLLSYFTYVVWSLFNMDKMSDLIDKFKPQKN